MSTRSKAKTGVASKATPNARLKGRGIARHDDMDVDGTGKENSISQGSAKPAKKQRKTARGKDSIHSRRPIDCICSKGDDGSPMILCAECKIWYHFTCVEMSEAEAEEINVYICPTCTVSTGRSSTMTWEGDQANEECNEDENLIAEKRRAALGTRRVIPVPLAAPEESEESSSSEDEYVDVEPEYVEDTKNSDKQRAQRSKSVTSNTSESIDETRKRRLSRVRVSSPPPSSLPTTLKRKATVSNVMRTSPAPKRKRSADGGSSAPDDPARKYCLGKLGEVFREVFLRYPDARANVKEARENKMNVDEDQKETKPDVTGQQEGKLSEEKTQALIGAANQFAQDLESCVFEVYSEPDKNGNPHAGGKYKERFRMLQFNLSKADRVVIHQRITSGSITAKEISLMSSTDLADEETKQSIKQAEQEALEHSILQRSTAPRAKITHKGLQDIESVNGDVPSALEVERHKEREVEEEERRERERMARLRTVQRQRTMSLSIPPESPSAPQSSDQQWGAPPPVPAHAMSPTVISNEETANKPPTTTTLGPQESGTGEPELNLSDFLNMDDEQEPSRSLVEQQTSSQTESIAAALNLGASRQSNTTGTPTGISPFAARPRTASFDLNALWNGPKNETQATTDSGAKAEHQIEPSTTIEPPIDNSKEDSDKDDAMELESVEANDQDLSVEANDQDFDMFLDEDKVESPTDLIVTPLQMEEVESLPQVWSGKIAMPLDSSVPQETHLVARQVAGKPLPADSPLWQTLFPTEQLRIEGRVPVENSMKYLMAMRLNPTKELYAAAFTASSAANVDDFKTFCNFLVSKNRHGLVFPWGSRPKDYHPGRELYMVPLLQINPLPEFVELLDNLKIPSTRTKDYLLGIWVLNKGKLAPLPGSTPPIAPPVAPQQPASFPPTNVATPPSQSTVYNAPPPAPALLPHDIPPVAAALAQLPGAPPIAPAALAAEVASLTPEQLQEVLRTLAATTSQIPLPLPNQMPPIGGHPPPPPPAIPSFNQPRPPFPPHGPTPPIANHTHPVPPNAQPWMHHSPPPPPPLQSYPMNYPPNNVPYQQPAPPRGGGPPQIPYDRHDNERDFRSGPHHSQGPRNDYEDRNWRNNSHNGNHNNRGNNRGRGNRNNDGHDRDFRRNSDSGWPRRQRNDSGGPPGW